MIAVMNNMNNLNSELGKVLEISAERFLQNHKDETYLAVNEEEFEKSREVILRSLDKSDKEMLVISQ